VRIGRGVGNGNGTAVTASVGIAVFEGGEGARAAETPNRADLAMSEARQGGRDGHRPYADR
jgi:GGDEF domain-containing protein